MQVFAPDPDFREIVRVMDDVRLRNQRRESMTLLNGGWENHPVAKLWAPWHPFLAALTLEYCDEVVRRGWKDSTAERLKQFYMTGDAEIPSWWGDVHYHSSHRASLLWKDPHHYSQFGWKEHPRYGYVYPE